MVITVPAYFDDAQRQGTKDAARLAGLHVLRLLNEPTAAAIAYGLDSGQEGVIAVYDLGGGTFDISILRLSRGVFEVLATGGDSALGGDDFDHLLADYLREQAGFSDRSDNRLQRELLDAAIAAKIALSDAEAAHVEVGGWQGDITRSQFNDLIAPLVKRTLLACRRALKDAGVEAQEVLEVVMVGGSTPRAAGARTRWRILWPHPADLHRPGQSRRHRRGDSGGYSGRQQAGQRTAAARRYPAVVRAGDHGWPGGESDPA